MTSVVNKWHCTECNSDNAHEEIISDDEVGHIMGCQDCGYYDVYREDKKTGKLIEAYQGYNHKYALLDLAYPNRHNDDNEIDYTYENKFDYSDKQINQLRKQEEKDNKK